MIRKQALQLAGDILAQSSIDDASFESELLLRHTLGIDRVQLYLSLDEDLSHDQEEYFWKLVDRRRHHEPTAYITGHREFYGTGFYVTPAVLIPRPETELLVEKAIDLIQKYHVTTVADIGTGCGAIAISLALRLSQIKIYATDISTSALEIALLNCERHGVMDRICRLYGDMLDPLPGPVDLVIANLPYVPASELPEESPNSEPLLALNGGPDGLEPIRRLCHQVTGKLRPEGHLLLEIGHGQCQPVTSLLRHLFPSARTEIIPDLSGMDRVVGLSRAPVMVTDAKR